MTKFIRTFHPIGQGAFYSEKHIISETSSITIVYDCGSDTITGAKLKKKINGALFEKGTNKIDILFISHFHEDHISGIKFLTPKIVIIPLLSDEDIIMLNFLNAISDVKHDIQFALNPQLTFPEAQIIRVSPEDNDSPLDNDFRTFDDLSYEEKIKSGTPIILDREESHWAYIPFNYNYKEKKEEFKKLIEKQELDYDKLKDVPYILENTEKIKNATKEMKGGPNEQSLIVYSGPNICDKFIYFNKPNMNCYHFYRERFPSGCLYFGDSKITKDLLNKLYQRIGKYIKNLGTIQIPHHGSRDSYSKLVTQDFKNNKDYCPYTINFVISCGTENQHGHPSDYVVEHLLSNGYLLNIVTENPSSILTQVVEY